MFADSFIDQPVAYLTNEIHTSANYIHMVISVILSGLCRHYYLKQDS